MKRFWGLVIATVALATASFYVHAQGTISENAYAFLTDGFGGNALKGLEKSKDFNKFMAGVGRITQHTVERVQNSYYNNKDEI